MWYSGTAHCRGGNIQAVTAPEGFSLRVWGVEPGSVHDLTAARIRALPALYCAAARASLPALAGPGYEGGGIGILIPVRQPPGGQELDLSTRTRNAIQRSVRCLGERGSARQGVVIQALELANMWMNDTDMHLAAIQASIITSTLAKAPDR